MTCQDCQRSPDEEFVNHVLVISGLAIAGILIAFGNYTRKALPDVGDNTARLASVHHHRGWHHHEPAQHKARSQESDSVGQDDEPHHDGGSRAHDE
jgi:hypothetical protein